MPLNLSGDSTLQRGMQQALLHLAACYLFVATILLLMLIFMVIITS